MDETPIVNTAQAGEPSTPLYDHVNNAVVNVPLSDLQTKLATGNYTMHNDEELHVISPDGEAGTLPAANAYKAIKSGYTVEDAHQRADRILNEKYGDSEGTAAVLGAARGMTGGLSDLALRKLGVPAETLSGLAEANPVASGLGEYGTMAASMFTGLGEANIGIKAAEGAGAVMEKTLAKGLTKATEKLGASGSVAKSLAAKIIPTATKMAAEGAVFAAEDLISEHALGHADFNAENIMATLGTGALIGAVGGGALHGVLGAAEAVGSRVAEGVGAKAEGLLDKSKAGAELLGFDTPSKISKLQERNPKFYNELPEYLKNDIGLTIKDSPQEVLNKIEASHKAAGEKIGQISDDVQAVMEAAHPGTMPTKTEVFGDMAKKLREEFVKPAEGVPGYEHILKPVNEYITKLEEQAAIGGELNIKDLMKLRQQTDALIKYEKVPGQFTMKENMLYKARTMLREEIYNIADAAATVDSRAAKMSSELKAANRLYSNAETIFDNLEKKIDKDKLVSFKDMVFGHLMTGSKLGAILGSAKVFADSDLRRKMVVLSQIEKSQQTIGKSMEKAVKNFFLKTKETVAPLTLKGMTGTALSLGDNGRKPKTRQEAFLNIQDNLHAAVADPDRALERSNKRTAGLYAVAPATSTALDAAALRGASFLQSKLPKQASAPSAIDVLKRPKLPSNFEMAKFERYVDAVENPIHVLNELGHGKLTHEHVEALQAVYPNLYKKLVDHVTDVVTKKPDAVPYNKRIALSTLLGVSLDESMLPQNLLALQGNFQSQPESGDAGTPVIKPNQKGLQNLGKADRMAVDTKTEV